MRSLTIPDEHYVTLSLAARLLDTSTSNLSNMRARRPDEWPEHRRDVHGVKVYPYGEVRAVYEAHRRTRGWL